VDHFDIRRTPIDENHEEQNQIPGHPDYLAALSQVSLVSISHQRIFRNAVTSICAGHHGFPGHFRKPQISLVPFD
jgi:hypothetical protein